MGRGKTAVFTLGLSCKKTFSLIELLITIAVIAVLVSLLLPLLNNVRGRGLSVACLNNTKQLGIVFSSYIDDSGGYMIIYLPQLRPWVRTDLGELWLGGYLNSTSKKLLIDPAHISPCWENNAVSLPYSYGLNVNLTLNDNRCVRSFQKNISRRALMIDTEVSDDDSQPFRLRHTTEKHITNAMHRHSNSVNILYLDMHSERMQNPHSRLPRLITDIFWRGY